MTSIFAKLPDELIRYTIEYSEELVYRNGKYMGRISNTDRRYKMIKSLKKTSLYTYMSGKKQVIELSVRLPFTLKRFSNPNANDYHYLEKTVMTNDEKTFIRSMKTEYNRLSNIVHFEY